MQANGGMTNITDISGKKCQDLIDQYPVMMFSKSYCPFCDQAKNLFTAQGVAFAAVELDVVAGGEAMANELKASTKQRTFPNTFIGKVHLGGCDDTKAALSNGKMKQMLDGCNVAHNI